MKRRSFLKNSAAATAVLASGGMIHATATAAPATLATKHRFKLKYAPHFGMFKHTTGEINYRNVFKHIHDKGFTGIVGMEHGNSIGGKEGEQAVIEAYVRVDQF